MGAEFDNIEKMATRADREEANRKYLKSKVDVHLNKLIIELLKGKPEDVV